MKEYLTSIANVLLDRTPQELIGAIMAALMLSLVMAGLYMLARNRVSDPMILVSSLVLVASVTSMVLAAGYIVRAEERIRRTGRGPRFDPATFPPRPNPGERLARRVFEAADGDHDGVLTTDEAVGATTEFLQKADPTGKGTVDIELFSVFMRERLFPPRGPFDPPPPGAISQPPYPGMPARQQEPDPPLAPFPTTQNDDERSTAK